MRKLFLLVGCLIFVASAQAQTGFVQSWALPFYHSSVTFTPKGGDWCFAHVDGATGLTDTNGSWVPVPGATTVFYQQPCLAGSHTLSTIPSGYNAIIAEYSSPTGFDGSAILVHGQSYAATASVTTKQPNDVVLEFIDQGTFVNGSVTVSNGTLENQIGLYTQLADFTAASPGPVSETFNYTCTAYCGTPGWSTTFILLTTAPLLPTVNLIVSGTAIYDDNSAILPGPLNISQQTAPNVFVQCGTISSDASGNLSGSLTINPNLVDANGNVVFMFNLPMNLPLMTYPVPVGEFQHGSTGLTINLMLFKQGPLAIKSQTLAVTP